MSDQHVDEPLPESGPIAADSPSPEVAAAAAELARLDELDLAEHPDAYQRIHAELQDALTAIDDA